MSDKAMTAAEAVKVLREAGESFLRAAVSRYQGHDTCRMCGVVLEQRDGRGAVVDGPRAHGIVVEVLDAVGDDSRRSVACPVPGILAALDDTATLAPEPVTDYDCNAALLAFNAARDTGESWSKAMRAALKSFARRVAERSRR